MAAGALMAAGAWRAEAQPLRARLSADSVWVGERFTLTLALEHPEPGGVTFPSPAATDSMLGDLLVLGQERFPTQAAPGGAFVDSIRYQVAVFRLDSAGAPPLAVTLEAPGGLRRFESAPLRIGVRRAAPPEATTLRDLAPLAAFPRPLWHWLLPGAAVAAAAWGVWRFARRRPAPAAPEAPPEPSPFAEAFARLKRLEQHPPATPAETRRYHVALSDALRAYLDAGLDVPAPRMTTPEVARALGYAARAEDPRRRLESVLAEADLVKYAAAQPAPEQSVRAVREAQSLLVGFENARRAPGRHAPPPPPHPSHA